MSSHDLAKDVKAYRDKHYDELRYIQSEIRFDSMSRKGRDWDESSSLTIKPLIKLVLSFIRSKGYSIDDTEHIIKGIGFSIPDDYINHIKIGLRAILNRKQTREQEVKHPPRYTTSKPNPPKDMTSTYKPKLNLSHIHQVHQPVSVPPSEKDRKLVISASLNHDKPGRKRHKRALGHIEGIEHDKRIWNSEKDLYLKAWKKVGDNINKLPKHDHDIHSTADVRAAVKKLDRGKDIASRLTSWR